MRKIAVATSIFLFGLLTKSLAQPFALLKDIHPTGSSNPQYLIGAGNFLFFVANDGTSGAELWKTDGTMAGTTMVKDINPGPLGSNPQKLTAIGSTLYFIANNGVHGPELWKTDGTVNGTVMVKDIYPGGLNSDINNMTAVGTVLYFKAKDPTYGIEVWRSDGTTAGTYILKNVYIKRCQSGNSRQLAAIFNCCWPNLIFHGYKYYKWL